ncbi:DUF1822 family protein [Phormidium tenue FACHB-886]|nr:DUF1822 family protein [Phormidium tenue FACHB-886]
MFTPSVRSTDPRFMLSTIIWLEDEDFNEAKTISRSLTREAKQWQAYLNTLALVSFKQWLQEHLLKPKIASDFSRIERIGHLSLDEFKIGVIATEHVLDEVIQVPNIAMHFYVVVEIVEEQEQAIIRGILQYDELIEYQKCVQLPASNHFFSLPFDLFDPEPSHLLCYCQFLEPSLMPSLPSVQGSELLTAPLRQITTQLTAWLRGEIAQGWQAIDSLVNAQTQLAFNTRSRESGVSHAKLINLELQLGHYAIVLLVSITPHLLRESNAAEKFSILVQLHPIEGDHRLLPNLKLLLLSKDEAVLQEVTSREDDDYIQLKPFHGRAGVLFYIQVCLADRSIQEAFEI